MTTKPKDESVEQRRKLWPYSTEKPPSREECPFCHSIIKLDEQGRFYRHIQYRAAIRGKTRRECPGSETRPDNW